MTATESLRAMLDERGVKWDGETYESCTCWNDETNLAVASEGIDGKLWVSQILTPEQAIAATLGRGECGRMTATEKAALCARIDELCAENERLRGQGERLFDKTLELGTENAKLRQLVRWMYDRMDESCAVQYPYAPAPISYDRLMQALARVRELGIEVDE